MFSICGGFFYPIQIFDGHVDGNRPQWVLKDLSCEFTGHHTGVSTLVKLWLVVIDVNDVDLYICGGAGLDPMDVYVSLSCLE